MVKTENRMAPPTAVACARRLNKVDHSAVPAESWAFALMSPIVRAASGSFKMTMKRPPTSGASEKPMAVKNGIFERRILSVSVQRAGRRLFILHLVSIAGNDLRDFAAQPQVLW